MMPFVDEFRHYEKTNKGVNPGQRRFSLETKKISRIKRSQIRGASQKAHHDNIYIENLVLYGALDETGRARYSVNDSSVGSESS
jgi:hypothetical protein